MHRRPPRSNRTDTLFPYTTLFRSPVLLLRADMDGLPVVEQTGLPFASKVKATARSGVETGVMHACGHDTHMTAWIGAARRLAAMKDQRSEEHTSELQSLVRISYAVFCLKKKKSIQQIPTTNQ